MEIKKNILFSVDMIKIMQLSINILASRLKIKKLYRGEISTNLNFKENNLFSNNSTIYENNDFQNENFKKKLFENFLQVFGLKILEQ